MKKADLALLLGLCNYQKEIWTRLLDDLAMTNPESPEKKSHLGYLLHNLYCSIENLMQETARTFENRLDDPSRYHRELLQRLHLEVPGIRPSLWSSRSYHLLNELRGFRHIFRHAYDYELDEVRLRQLQEKVLANWGAVERDVERFGRFLQQVCAAA
jgi:hypothetical protein